VTRGIKRRQHVIRELAVKFGVEEKTAQIAALAVAEIRDLNRTLEYIVMEEKERRGTIWRTLSWYYGCRCGSA
jgi:hypothetical protein